MKVLIFIELVTIAFAATCAWLNSVPVNAMKAKDPKHWESSEFHQANAFVKTFWAGTCARLMSEHGWQFFILLIILWLIQWLIFDPVLNVFTHEKWYYLGKTAVIDELVKNGKIKAGVVLLIIIALNFILWK